MQMSEKKEMTQEQALKLLEHPIYKWSMDWDEREDGLNYTEAIEIAIAALRPVSRELVEEVWPGCPYCKEDGEGYVKKFGAYSILDGEVTTGHCKPQKIKFCPHCSCPLTDEAVEMVMERINEIMEEMKYEH